MTHKNHQDAKNNRHLGLFVFVFWLQSCVCVRTAVVFLSLSVALYNSSPRQNQHRHQNSNNDVEFFCLSSTMGINSRLASLDFGIEGTVHKLPPGQPRWLPQKKRNKVDWRRQATTRRYYRCTDNLIRNGLAKSTAHGMGDNCPPLSFRLLCRDTPISCQRHNTGRSHST